MATVTRKRTRGRKKGELRLAAASMAAKVTGGNAKEFTIEVVPQNGRKKAESITVEYPSGSVLVPVELTTEKSEENAREQLRLAIEDAGRKGEVGVNSVEFASDAGEAGILWVLVLRKPKAEAKAPAKGKK